MKPGPVSRGCDMTLCRPDKLTPGLADLSDRISSIQGWLPACVFADGYLY